MPGLIFLRLCGALLLCCVALQLPAPVHADNSALAPYTLPDSAIPAHAHLRTHYGSADDALSASGLHTDADAATGQLGGLVERAEWTRHRQTVSLLYSVALFRSPDEAAWAHEDALESCWELGSPLHLAGVAQTVFVLREQERWRLVATAWSGAAEIEMELEVPVGKPQLGQTFLALLPADASPTNPPEPTPFEASTGVGPVVKSPSLMVLDARTLPVPGLYRDTLPPLVAAQRPPLTPPGATARFVRSGDVAGVPVYDEALLYETPDAARQGMQALQTPAEMTAYVPPGVPQVDDVAGFRGRGEQIVALRNQNVLLLLAMALPASGIGAMASQVNGTVPTWLHAVGTQIETAAGTPIRLAGLNWYGAEENDFVPGGLDVRPYRAILDTIRDAGYNTIRLPFSNQMVESNPVVTGHLAANPDLAGLHALDILDRIIAYAGAIGLSVVLDDHRSDAGWSAEPLWYTAAYPESAWLHDWTTLAARYAGTDVVVAADLRNEPHGQATWGGAPADDWHAAAQRAGDAVLIVNPHLLIMVEGVQFYGSGRSTANYWWGGNLQGVKGLPVALRFASGAAAQSQLVYSPHDYGPDACKGACPWFNTATTPASLAAIWEQNWGYITADPGQPYAAPLWLGEFGTCNQSPACGSDSTPGSQGQWFSSLVAYLAAKKVGWAYWSANGSQSTADTRSYGALDWYGFFGPDWNTPCPWLATQLNPIQTFSLSSPVPSPSSPTPTTPSPSPTPAATSTSPPTPVATSTAPPSPAPTPTVQPNS